MDTKHYKRKKRRNQSRLVFAIFMCIFLIIVLSSLLLFIIMHWGEEEVFPPLLQPETETELAVAPAPATEAPEPVTEEQTVSEKQEEQDFSSLVETDIYTFLQGPKAWASKTDWSGTWNSVVLADQEFSVFGCGLCDLANIYSTLTPFDCSPLDMYYYAQEASGYRPVSGYGAIDWPYLKQTLAATGIRSRLRKKDKSYEKFREKIASSITAIVLVCSYDDDTYWHDVEGHYVNIWLYNEEDDTVFLADSGNPDHNRQRIPLRDIYDALKSSSRYQYLIVTDVDEDANTWGHDGIDIRWRKPKYYKKRKSIS